MSANNRTSDALSTQIITTEKVVEDELVLRLRGTLPAADSAETSSPLQFRRTVTFTPDTVDNEHLGRLKSNCCCIYVPPRTRDIVQPLQDEHETEHCRGHTIPVILSSAKETSIQTDRQSSSSPSTSAELFESLLDEHNFDADASCPLKGLCC